MLVGGEAVYHWHETCTVGVCFMLECSRGRGCREGQEGAGGPPNTKKMWCVACFSCHGGGGGYWQYFSVPHRYRVVPGGTSRIPTSSNQFWSVLLRIWLVPPSTTWNWSELVGITQFQVEIWLATHRLKSDKYLKIKCIFIDTHTWIYYGVWEPQGYLTCKMR